MWEVTEVFHLPDSVSCQRQEAVGEWRGTEKELNHRTAGGKKEATRHSGPWLGSWMTSGDTWPSGVREAELGLLDPQLTKSQAWRGMNQLFGLLSGFWSFILPTPCLSPGITYRKEGMQARFSIRWILFCRNKPNWGN